MQLLLCVITERLTAKSELLSHKTIFFLKQIREGITFRIKFHFSSFKTILSFSSSIVEVKAWIPLYLLFRGMRNAKFGFMLVLKNKCQTGTLF